MLCLWPYLAIAKHTHTHHMVSGHRWTVQCDICIHNKWQFAMNYTVLLLPVSLSDWARGEPSNGWPECVTKIDMANNNNNERFEWIWMWTPMIDSSRFSLNAEHIYNSINEFNFALFCVGLGTFSVPPSHTKHWHWHKSAFMHRNYYLQRTVQRRFGIKK